MTADRMTADFERATGKARPWRRSGRLMVLMAAAAIGLAACGSGSADSPHVASLGKKGNGSESFAATGTSSPAARHGNATQLLNEWAACMRKHGDPGQADPTITASKLIDIAWSAAVPGGVYGTNKGGQGNSGPGQYCRQYLSAAQAALRGGQPLRRPDLATMLKYSECMRANGITDFPDPTASGLSLNVGGDLSPANPTFRNASRLCARKTGAPAFGVGTPPPGTVELNGGGPGTDAGASAGG